MNLLMDAWTFLNSIAVVDYIYAALLLALVGGLFAKFRRVGR